MFSIVEQLCFSNKLRTAYYNDDTIFTNLQALPLVTILVGRERDGDICRIFTLAEGPNEPKLVEFLVPKIQKLEPGSPKWANYIKGVVAKFPGKQEYDI